MSRERGGVRPLLGQQHERPGAGAPQLVPLRTVHPHGDLQVRPDRDNKLKLRAIINMLLIYTYSRWINRTDIFIK